MRVITRRHQAHAASSEWPVDYKMPLSGSHDLHILHNENRLPLSCRSRWTVSAMTPTAPFLDGVWLLRPVCRCVVHID